MEAVHEDAPGERPSDEDAAVGVEDAAEARVGLEGRDEAMGGQRKDAEPDEHDAPLPGSRLTSGDSDTIAGRWCSYSPGRDEPRP